MRLERPSRPRRKGSTQLPTSRFALVTVLGIRQDCSSRALGVHAEPDTASIERDNTEVAGLYPVTRRHHFGRLRRNHDTFEAHESNRIENYLGVEI